MVEIFAPVLGTVQEFIDWSLTIVSIMIIWYVVKFFIVAPPTKAEKEIKEKEWAERGAKGREWLKGKYKEHKTKEEKERKKDLVSPIKENLKDAIEAAEEALHLIGTARTEHDHHQIHKTFKKFDQEMKHAWGNIRLLRRKAEGAERDFLTQLLNEVEAVKDHVNDNLRDKLPEMGVNFLAEAKAKEIDQGIKKVRGVCHDIWKKVEKFHE